MWRGAIGADRAASGRRRVWSTTAWRGDRRELQPHFYHNTINNGLLAITCPCPGAGDQPGDEVTVDLDTHDPLRRETFSFPPMSDSVRRIVEAGGLIEMVKQRLAQAGTTREDSTS
ncbi:MAG: hypothetical protein R2856_30920 [Caldilineaceae bacterium]